MQKKLCRHGDDYVLIIDEPILEQLKITPDTLLDVSVSGESIIVTPIRNEEEQI